MNCKVLILLLISVSPYCCCLGQIHPISPDDKAQISRYIFTLNLELAADFDSTFIGIDIDSLIASEKADSLDELANELTGSIGWEYGEVVYSPDNVFKIFTIAGNSGGSSKSMYYSFIHIHDTTVLNMSWEYSILDSIVKVSDSTYVIIDYSYPGYIYGSTTYNFRLLKLQRDTLMPISIDYSEYDLLDGDDYKYFDDYFSISSLYGLEDWSYMKYTRQSNTIQFQYAISYFVADVYDKIPEDYLPLDENEALVVSGEIDLNQGYPKLQNQTFKKIKMDW